MPIIKPNGLMPDTKGAGKFMLALVGEPELPLTGGRRIQPRMENNLQTHEQLTKQIEALLPKEEVIKQAKSFLERCDWELEIDSTMISIPENTEICIRSRAYVKAAAEDVFLNDHYEAVVLIGTEAFGEYKRAKYGVLKMYFNLKGEFVSEDRYNKYF